MKGTPPPSPTPRSFGINKMRGEGGQNLELKELTGKILRTKELALSGAFRL